MSIDSSVKDFLSKTKIFFVGNAQQLRKNLSSRSIKLASLAEALVPIVAEFGYGAFYGELPPDYIQYTAAVSSVEGILRLSERPLSFAFKKYEEFGRKIIKSHPIPEIILLGEPTGIIGKMKDARDIYFKIIDNYFPRNSDVTTN